MKIPLGLVLRRGLRQRCPRCGEGALFRKWIHAHERCPVCGVVYLRNYGDIWMFVIITDRIPIFFGIVAVYFGYQSLSKFAAALFFIALTVPIVATMKARQGLAIALDYVWRIYMPDPSDEIHRRDYVINR
ncbi:MAG TPA: hypothetical protein VF824_09995 [Thermoanaerobaculia bacterium]